MVPAPVAFRTPALLLLALALAAAPGHGRSAAPADSGAAVGEDLRALLSDVAAYGSAPLRFSGRDWLLAGGAAGATAMVMAQDSWINAAVARPTTSDYNGDAWDIPTFYGSTLFALGSSLATYTVGTATGDAGLRVTGRLMLTSLASSQLTVTVAKYIFGRARPSTGNGPWSFGWFEGEFENHSLPSGHTSAAFAISTILAERINTAWARLLLYGMATLTGCARVRNNFHWPSDVFGGALIGLASGFSALAQEEARTCRGPSPGTGLRLSPSPGGLTLSYWLP